MSSKNLSFTDKEYQRRVERVREHMRLRAIDVLLIDQTEFLAYITGYGISENMYRACLLPLEGEPVAILRAMDRTPFEESSWFIAAQAVTFCDWEDPVTVLADAVNSRGWASKRIGLDEDSYCMPLRRFKALQQKLPSTNFVDFSGVLDIVRARKSEEEVAYLRRAAEIGDSALQDIVASVREGDTARNAAGVAHSTYIRLGGDSIRPGIFNIGEGDAFLHRGMSDQVLKKGDILHMEILPAVRGYGTRLMRPAVVGTPTPHQKKVSRSLLEIQDLQFRAMKSGVNAAIIDDIARSAILKLGLRADYVNITGYSLGYYPPSTPRTSDFTRIFHPKANWVLESGMVFHMYVSADGIAFSETVLITEDGYESLTRAPRQLFQI